MVANPSKFQLSFKVQKHQIKSSDTVELLGITLDKNINFKRHIQNICHKANNKTKGLFRIRISLNISIYFKY